MLLGYARISDKRQNIDRQILELEKAGAEKIFAEAYTGSDFKKRVEFNKLLKFARESDFIIVDSLERLGRDYDELIKVISYLDNNNIGLIVLNLPILQEFGTNELMNKVMRGIIIQLYSYMAQQELEEMKRKQAQGIAAAKTKGVYTGKKREYHAKAKDIKKRLVYEKVVSMLIDNVSIKKIHEETKLSRTTIYSIKKDVQTLF